MTVRPSKHNCSFAHLSASAYRLKGICVLLCSLVIAACSDTDTIDNINDPPFRTEVAFPFMYDGDIYEYLLNTNEVGKFFETDDRKIVLLDTDIPKRTTDDNDRRFYEKDSLPDALAYAENNVLFLIDLNTRYTHRLYDFNRNGNLIANLVLDEDLESFDSTGPETICDLGKSSVYDSTALDEGAPILIEEDLIYVSAVPVEFTCEDIDEIRYYSISFLSSGRTYDVREAPLDQDLSSPVNSSYPILVGAKQVVSEALMFAGAPILLGDRYYFFGFDQRSTSLQAYEVDSSTFVKTHLWSLESEEFLIQANHRRNILQSYSLDSFENRQPFFTRLGSFLFAEHGYDIIRLDLSQILDDDADAERESALNNPLYERTPMVDYEPVDFQIRSSTQVSFVTDEAGIVLHTLSTENDDVNELNLTSTADNDISIVLSENLPLVHKQSQLDDRTAITTYDGTVERTLYPRTTESLSLGRFNLGEAAYLNIEDSVNNTWDSRLYEGPNLRTELDDSLIVPYTDIRFRNQGTKDTVNAILLAENQQNLSTTSQLTYPTAFEFSGNFAAPVADTIFTAENYIFKESAENQIKIFSDFFGLANLNALRETPEGGTEFVQMQFFFNPIDAKGEPELPSELIPLL